MREADDYCLQVMAILIANRTGNVIDVARG
jgi:hypothetical protein